MFDTSWNANIGGSGWGVVISGGDPYGGYYPGTGGLIYPNQTTISGQTNQMLMIGLVVVAAVLILK